MTRKKAREGGGPEGVGEGHAGGLEADPVLAVALRVALAVHSADAGEEAVGTEGGHWTVSLRISGIHVSEKY